MIILTIPECAKRARVSARTMWRFHAEGRGPKAFKIGGKVMVAEDDFNAWINGLRNAAGESAA